MIIAALQSKNQKRHKLKPPIRCAQGKRRHITHKGKHPAQERPAARGWLARRATGTRYTDAAYMFKAMNFNDAILPQIFRLSREHLGSEGEYLGKRGPKSGRAKLLRFLTGHSTQSQCATSLMLCLGPLWGCAEKCKAHAKPPRRERETAPITLSQTIFRHENSMFSRRVNMRGSVGLNWTWH